jgi:exonuclease III
VIFVRNKIDIVCLQETNSTEKVELKWERECGANSIWNHGLNNSRGVAILFSEKFNYDISDITRDIPGRKISCKINVSGHHGLNLVNVYFCVVDHCYIFSTFKLFIHYLVTVNSDKLLQVPEIIRSTH